MKDISPATQSKFLKIVRENLSIKTPENKEKSYKDSITQISAPSREEEIDLIAKTIKQLILLVKENLISH